MILKRRGRFVVAVGLLVILFVLVSFSSIRIMSENQHSLASRREFFDVHDLEKESTTSTNTEKDEQEEVVKATDSEEGKMQSGEPLQANIRNEKEEGDPVTIEVDDAVKEQESYTEEWQYSVLHPTFSNDLAYYTSSKLLFTSLPPRQYVEKTQLKSPSYTIVCAVHFSSILYISLLENMWPGQVACTLFIPSHISQSTALTSLSNLELSSRVQVVAWFQGNSTFTDAHHYPINALRNAAISVVRTTHYLVIDEGMLLAPSLSTKLNYINKELLHERGTIILPLFFFTRTDHIPPNCIQDMRCVQEMSRQFPVNKEKLQALIAAKRVSFQSPSHTHHYLYADWFYIKSEKRSVPLTCFEKLLQEPLLFVPNRPTTPLFDERFVDGSFSRIQYVEHLRLVGFKFNILNQSFGMMLPEAIVDTADFETVKKQSELHMRYLFIKWFDEVKREKVPDRTRVCSAHETIMRKEAALKTLRSFNTQI